MSEPTRLPARPRKLKRIFVRFLMTMLVLFVVLLIVDQIFVFSARHITIGRETTYLTTPLGTNGVPDYLAAMNADLSAGVTPANNAAGPLLEIARWQDETEEQKREISRILGAGPDPKAVLLN